MGSPTQVRVLSLSFFSFLSLQAYSQRGSRIVFFLLLSRPFFLTYFLFPYLCDSIFLSPSLSSLFALRGLKMLDGLRSNGVKTKPV